MSDRKGLLKIFRRANVIVSFKCDDAERMFHRHNLPKINFSSVPGMMTVGRDLYRFIDIFVSYNMGYSWLCANHIKIEVTVKKPEMDKLMSSKWAKSWKKECKDKD